MHSQKKQPFTLLSFLTDNLIVKKYFKSVFSALLTGILSFQVSAQTAAKPINKQSLFFELNGDSLSVYECKVQEASQELTTTDGTRIKTGTQKFTITTKYFIKCIENAYHIRIYTAGITPFPNRKFSGLKIREKKYWAFHQDTSFVLSDKQLALFLAAENKGKEANEYDYAITKHTHYQLIYKRRKNFKQLVFDEILDLKKRLITKS